MNPIQILTESIEDGPPLEFQHGDVVECPLYGGLLLGAITSSYNSLTDQCVVAFDLGGSEAKWFRINVGDMKLVWRPATGESVHETTGLRHIRGVYTIAESGSDVANLTIGGYPQVKVTCTLDGTTCFKSVLHLVLDR